MVENMVTTYSSLAFKCEDGKYPSLYGTYRLSIFQDKTCRLTIETGRLIDGDLHTHAYGKDKHYSIDGIKSEVKSAYLNGKLPEKIRGQFLAQIDAWEKFFDSEESTDDEENEGENNV